MIIPVPYSRPPAAPEPPALVRVVTREDVTWARPVFKAPPLRVQPPLADVAAFLADRTRDPRAA